MAKGCIGHAIQYDAGDGWYTGVGGVFRADESEQRRRFKRAVEEAPDGYSVRLIEIKVLQQHNRTIEAPIRL